MARNYQKLQETIEAMIEDAQVFIEKADKAFSAKGFLVASDSAFRALVDLEQALGMIYAMRIVYGAETVDITWVLSSKISDLLSEAYELLEDSQKRLKG